MKFGQTLEHIKQAIEQRAEALAKRIDTKVSGEFKEAVEQMHELLGLHEAVAMHEATHDDDGKPVVPSAGPARGDG